MSDSNRITLSYVEEVTYGVTPGTNQTAVRHTGEGLGADTNIEKSNEIRSDGQVADVKRVARSASGDVNIEMSYGAHDDLIEAAIRSAGFSAKVTVGPGITFSVTAGSGSYVIADSANGFGSVVVGQWVEIRGFTGSAIVNNGYGKVTAAAAGSITVKGNGDGFTTAAGDTVTVVMGAQIVNGTSNRSFSLQKQFSDLTNQFEILTGMCIDGFTYSVESNSIPSGSFSFLGQSAATATSTAGTVDAAPENEVFGSVDEVLGILEAYGTQEATSFNFTVANNRRLRNRIANLGPKSIGMGRFEVSGNLVMYFESETEMDKYLNFTSTSLTILFEDADGNAMIFDLPRVKYTAGRRVASGNNTDVMAEMSFEAFFDPTEDITLRIAKFAAADA